MYFGIKNSFELLLLTTIDYELNGFDCYIKGLTKDSYGIETYLLTIFDNVEVQFTAWCATISKSMQYYLGYISVITV